ncbi:NUDIX hydrolase [Nocardia sp. NBC_01388]|uniref:NUDIX hydrolase n=1 Tax=Nocardia sp. NBC_01388 TaxID=2903596 RepID=UPI0032563D2B
MTTATEGTQILLVNDRQQVLMYLRDDFPHIPFPNMWSLLGGMLEAGETPAECIVREIEEEIGVVLDPAQVDHYATRDCSFGIEHTYLARVGDLDISTLTLTEGQGLQWFSENDALKPLAYADNEILGRWFTSQRATDHRP